MQIEIINPQGNVSYRRPHDHPDVMEALRTPGYSVRGAEPKGEPQVRISAGLEGTEPKTLNRPTAAGWWWTRPDSGCVWRIVEITTGEHGEMWIQEMGDEEPDKLRELPWWEWAGPLTPTVPPNDQAQRRPDNAAPSATKGNE